MRTIIVICLASIVIVVGYFGALSMKNAGIGLLVAFVAWICLLAWLMRGRRG